ncbi:DUF397 domain-containing protein [Kitasatospora sp. NPDC001574]
MTDSTWRKSSHSGNEDSYCVEVAGLPHEIRVRDSKDPDGPQLSFPPVAWSAFLDQIRRDTFDG